MKFNNIDELIKNKDWKDDFKQFKEISDPNQFNMIDSFTVEEHILTLFHFLYCNTETDINIKEQLLDKMLEDKNSILHKEYYGYPFVFLIPPNFSREEDVFEYIEHKTPIYLKNFLTINDKYPSLNKFFNFDTIFNHVDIERIQYKYDNSIMSVFLQLNNNSDMVFDFCDKTNFKLFENQSYYMQASLDEAYNTDYYRNTFYFIMNNKIPEGEFTQQFAKMFYQDILKYKEDKKEVPFFKQQVFTNFFYMMSGKGLISEFFNHVANDIQNKNFEDRNFINQYCFKTLLNYYKNSNDFPNIHINLLKDLDVESLLTTKQFLQKINLSKDYEDLYDLVNIYIDKETLKNTFNSGNVNNIRKNRI